MSVEGMDRRTFVRRLGTVGAAASVPGLLAACAKDDEKAGSKDAVTDKASKDAISFVSLYGTSGLQAELGQEAVEGLRLVPDAVGGTLLGRQLKVNSYDTQEKIDEAVRRAREASSAGFDFFFGGLLSNVSLAVGEEVNKRGGMFATGAGADEITGEECRAAVFRWSVATYAAVHETVEPLVKRDSSLKRWYTITPDYVFGQALLRETKKVLAANGAQHVGDSLHGLDATEFSGYVNNAASKRPDVLCILNFGAQSTTTVKQAVSFGLKEKMTILLVWGGGLSQFKALGAETMEGVYAGAQYWHTVDAPGNREFVELFRKKVGGNPSYAGALGYVTGKLAATGIEKAKSADPAAVIKALEGLQYEGPTGSETVRAEDHQVIKDYYLLRGKAKPDIADDDDLMEIVSKGNTAVPVAEGGCTLRALST